jgi:hypothetical protein
VLLTGSEIDEWVPVWRTRETGEVLSGLGAKLSTIIYPDRPHIVCADEIVQARAMLAGAVKIAAVKAGRQPPSHVGEGA